MFNRDTPCMEHRRLHFLADAVHPHIRKLDIGRPTADFEHAGPRQLDADLLRPRPKRLGQALDHD